MTTSFVTPDLNCGGCAAAIRQALSRQPGVLTCDVSVPAKRVEVAYDPAATSPERLAGALASAGYPPARNAAPAAAPPHARIDAALA